MMMTTDRTSIWMFLTLSIGVVEILEASEILLSEAYKQHVARVDSYPCGVPQETIVPTHEALGSQMSPHLNYTPSSTVLYRCDRESGCCPHSDFYHCSMETEETVVLVFKVTDCVENIGRVELANFKVMNHTSCSCRDSFAYPPR